MTDLPKQTAEKTSLMSRALRSSVINAGGFAAFQFLRLLSNLVLTRLLFPEAFGLMALVTVVMIGLSMFSDMGTSPAIMQSKRGDEPDFLNTAWTLQILRGFGLWLAACVLAYPIGQFYGEPLLTQILPFAALSLLIGGFNPTKLETANRHLRAGRVTLIELAVQACTLLIAITAAWALQSVWALVISGIAGAVINLILLHLWLPGPGNRLRWDQSATAELVHFGKWIFLSTICGFLVAQGDKLLIGKYLSLDQFGVYNIGYFLASFPLMLGGMVTHKVLIPIYRQSPPDQSRENFLALRRMRLTATAFLVATLLMMAALGPWLVGLLYDDRYAGAKGIVTLLAAMQIPQVIVLTYDRAALANGDSRRFFVLALARAVLLLGALALGLQYYGLIGGLIGIGLSGLLAYPVVVWLARHQGAWDPLHDLAFTLLGGLGAFAVLYWHWHSILTLLP
ncbi:oligosaccharide flippase family protein [Thalassobius sp. Cn5-15]|uniref:oligosaccharide flippase family protein n=1 Tax=Thalassobius sp. Cn5-15 TaxID=2917763 RepID=UPI001EF30799|nr:oligosaccharide flippase family protein [Thalassobius sp. Cn5-15]MCG7494062.1 oligosaccharide flippase family protein [Thalassobius sp. Cn5-15]